MKCEGVTSEMNFCGAVYKVLTDSYFSVCRWNPSLTSQMKVLFCGTVYCAVHQVYMVVLFLSV